jgi:hypothetical protein
MRIQARRRNRRAFGFWIITEHRGSPARRGGSEIANHTQAGMASSRNLKNFGPRRYFPENPPARIFINVPTRPGHFDIEIDCVAAML